ncbi:MAG: electron transfer flavoprotein subunit beta/FixA family protein [Bdellovibrionales bacterium]|nr:electron transfer flavoprotein subunit beta/FixA family protein [Bdellovibrionales bacterium]
MKIGVCIKQVPDTGAKIKINSDGKGVSEEGVKFVISPYDEFAIEEAIRLKEKGTASEVIAITVGVKRTTEALRSALALGCDKAIHIDSESTTLDHLAVASLLSEVIKKHEIQLVFLGRNAADDDSAQVGPMLAELLQLPQVTGVSKLTIEDRNIVAERDIEGGAKQIWSCELPAVITTNKGLNEPRYASLKGIMQAKNKPLETISLGSLGVSSEILEPKVQLDHFELPKERSAGKIFKDDTQNAVAKVVQLLRQEAKVI